MHFENDNDFEEFKIELQKRLNVRAIRNINEPSLKPSAVKMILMNKNNEPHVLLTKRSEKVTSHKGQISFPGGTFDKKDGDIIVTAFRETFEEVGIPREKIEFLGRFDDYFSIAGFHVACFIGAIEYPFAYSFSTDEIDDYVEAPLSIFAEKKYDRTEVYNYQGREVTVYFYNYEGHEIWGLTARILTDFGEIIRN